MHQKKDQSWLKNDQGQPVVYILNGDMADFVLVAALKIVGVNTRNVGVEWNANSSISKQEE